MFGRNCKVQTMYESKRSGSADALKVKLLEEFELRNSKENNATNSEQAYFSLNRNRNQNETPTAKQKWNAGNNNKKYSQNNNFNHSFCHLKGHPYSQCFKSHDNVPSNRGQSLISITECANSATSDILNKNTIFVLYSMKYDKIYFSNGTSNRNQIFGLQPDYL